MEFCARCGRPRDGSIPFIGPLCLNCFLETTELLCIPRTITIDMCKYCLSVKISGKWLASEDFYDAIVRHLALVLSRVKKCNSLVREYELAEIKPLTKPSWRTIIEARYLIRLDNIDEIVEKTYELTVFFKPTICPLCKEIRGGDYNVLVQTRARPQDLPELVSTINKIMNTNTQIAKNLLNVIEKQGGLDLLFHDKGAAMKLIRELRKQYNIKMNTSEETVGINSHGKLRRRLVISLHISRRS
ncbi:MAG: NMD3-related protein [Pyrodictiaceae archaeon]